MCDNNLGDAHIRKGDLVQGSRYPIDKVVVLGKGPAQCGPHLL